MFTLSERRTQQQFHEKPRTYTQVTQTISKFDPQHLRRDLEEILKVLFSIVLVRNKGFVSGNSSARVTLAPGLLLAGSITLICLPIALLPRRLILSTALSLPRNRATVLLAASVIHVSIKSPQGL